MGTYPSAQQELPNEYQHDKVKMVFKDFCVLIYESSLSIGRVKTLRAPNV